MTNIFMAGPDLVRWELTAFGADGPYRLTLNHPRGSIIEYFPTPLEALRREAELEALLTSARGAGESAGRGVR